MLNGGDIPTKPQHLVCKASAVVVMVSQERPSMILLLFFCSEFCRFHFFFFLFFRFCFEEGGGKVLFELSGDGITFLT